MEHDISKELRFYKLIYGALVFFSIVTVCASYLPTPVALGILIALAIAGFKASLVASFFMHLASEKPVIFAIMIFTVFCFVAMMGLIIFNQHNIYEGAYYVVN